MMRPTHISERMPEQLRARLAELADGAEAEPVEPTGGSLEPETADERAQRLAKRTAWRTARWVEQRPLMYETATLEDFVGDTHTNDTDAQKVLRFVADAGPLNLALAGPVGTGKTHMAYAIGNRLIETGLAAEAWVVVDMLEKLRPGGEPGLGQRLRDTDLLILDDLGAGKASEWAVEQMTALIDARIRERRRTIITTNVPEPELEAAWGGRCMDRLRYRREVIVFRGESRRTAAWT